jgi:thiosulfate/3-mercaptopyruvate sulfurtransferase
MGDRSKGPLITVGELDRLMADGPRPALLDVRWEVVTGPRRDLYDQGHIPGAAFIDLDAELASAPGADGRHPLPDPTSFERAMRTAGVDRDRPVVVYDEATAVAAARGWWLLRYFSHPAVVVLDGGLAAWRRAGRALEEGAQRPRQRGDFVARPGGMPVLDATGAHSLAARGVLLDARSPERFRGQSELIDPVAGHIPGARNRPTTLNVTADGLFAPAAQLRDAFSDLGARDGVEVGAYCGSGVTAAHQVLALELAGYRAALYPGSWSEWITDPARPVATGDDMDKRQS